MIKVSVSTTQSFAARYIDSEPAEPSFDPEILARYIERLVMATEPWQAWCKDLQRLYRWEQPLRTAMWYAFFTYLWRKQRVMSFLVGSSLCVLAGY